MADIKVVMERDLPAMHTCNHWMQSVQTFYLQTHYLGPTKEMLHCKGRYCLNYCFSNSSSTAPHPPIPEYILARRKVYTVDWRLAVFYESIFWKPVYQRFGWNKHC